VEEPEDPHCCAIIDTCRAAPIAERPGQDQDKGKKSDSSRTGVNQRMRWRPELIAPHVGVPFSIPYGPQSALKQKEEHQPHADAAQPAFCPTGHSLSARIKHCRVNWVNLGLRYTVLRSDS